MSSSMKKTLHFEKIRDTIRADSNFYKLVISMFVSCIAGPSTGQIFPLYFQKNGISLAEIGLIASIAGFAGILSSIISGKLSDMIGRKPVILAGYFSYPLVCMILLISPYRVSFYLVEILRMITTGMYFTADYALISDVIPPARRGIAMGIWQSIALSLGAIIDQIVTVGMIYNRFGIEVYLVLVALFQIIGGLIVLLFVNETKHQDAKPASIRTRGHLSEVHLQSPFHLSSLHFSVPLLLYLFSSGFRALGQSMLMPLFSIYLMGIGASITEMSMVFALAWVVQLIAPTFFGTLSDKIGRKRLLLAGIIIEGISYVSFISATSFPQVLLARLVENLGLSIVTPVGIAFLTDFLVPSERGFGIGFYQSILRIDSAASGVLGGTLAQFYGFSMIFTIAAVASTISALIIFFFVEERKQK